MGFTVLYFVLLGYVPLFMGLETLLTEGFSPRLLQKPRTMRDIYINPDAAYIPMQGLLEAFRFVGLSTVGIWFIHQYRIGRQRAFSLLMILLCIFWLISTGQRWPLLHFLLIALVYFSYTTPPHELRRALIRMIGFGAAFGVIISALQARTSDISGYLPEVLSFGVVNLAERILYGNAIAPVLSFDVFPREYDWLYGQSYIQNLLSYLPGPYPSFPVTFNYMVMKEQVGFTAPPDFYTEAYVNFGVLGVVVISFLAGIGLAFLDVWLQRYRASVLGVSAISVITTYAFLICTTSVTFSLRPLVVIGTVLMLFQLTRWIDIVAIAGSVRRERSPKRPSQLTQP
jgi:oligosaccharide repeat unit polymerase